MNENLQVVLGVFKIAFIYPILGGIYFLIGAFILRSLQLIIRRVQK